MVGLYREKGWKRQIKEETQQKKCDSYGQLKQHETTATENISFFNHDMLYVWAGLYNLLA